MFLQAHLMFQIVFFLFWSNVVVGWSGLIACFVLVSDELATVSHELLSLIPVSISSLWSRSHRLQQRQHFLWVVKKYNRVRLRHKDSICLHDSASDLRHKYPTGFFPVSCDILYMPDGYYQQHRDYITMIKHLKLPYVPMTLLSGGLRFQFS